MSPAELIEPLVSWPGTVVAGRPFDVKVLLRGQSSYFLVLDGSPYLRVEVVGEPVITAGSDRPVRFVVTPRGPAGTRTLRLTICSAAGFPLRTDDLTLEVQAQVQVDRPALAARTAAGLGRHRRTGAVCPSCYVRVPAGITLCPSCGVPLDIPYETDSVQRPDYTPRPAVRGFVGRADELARIAAAAIDPNSRGLFVSGAAGLGKSRLLREAVVGLPMDQYAVHVAAGNLASSGLPFGGLAQVLPPDLPAGLSPAGLLRWVLDALHEDANGRPIVLAIDDVHLLDPPSAALAHLLVREGGTLLGTLRTAERAPLPISALWTEGLVDHAELEPLSPTESRDLLSAMVGGPIDASSAYEISSLGGGNPLLLRELVTGAATNAHLTRAFGVWRWDGEIIVTPNLTDLIENQIRGLPVAAREVLEMVAFGEPIGLPLLAGVTDAAAIEEAEERGLIRVVEDGYRHNVRLIYPLYGEVIRRRCPVTRARRHMSLLADLIEQSGARRHGDLLRLVMLRFNSGTAQDARLLLTAAQQAFGQFALLPAAQLAAAARNAGAGYEAAELHATALLSADRAADAMAVLDSVTDAPLERLTTARAVVGFWGLGRPEVPDELAAAAATTSDAALRTRIRSIEAAMRMQIMDIVGGEAIAREVLAEPGAAETSRQVATSVLAFLAGMRGDPEESGRLLAGIPADRTMWSRDNPALQYMVPVAHGLRASMALDLSGIDHILTAEFAQLSQTGGFRYGSAWAYMLQAHSCWIQGRTNEAFQAAELACAMSATSQLYNGNAHACRALVAALRGDLTSAAESMTIAERAAGTHGGQFYISRVTARAWVAACTGDMTTAVRIMSSLVGRLRADGFLGHELIALYDLVRLGRADLAAGRMTELLDSIPAGRASALLLRHAQAAADGDGEALLSAARNLSDNGYLIFAAEAAAGAVRVLRSARNPRALPASTLLADVLARCDSVRTPALRAVQPALTGRERQVAALAAEGVRSREIADRLYLSPRTVENHLQRVYAKLGVGDRVSLAAALQPLREATAAETD